MSKSPGDAPPQSDCFDGAPHPRQTFVLFGHAEAEAELLSAYQAGRLPHAFIFGGPEGIGKATLAWRLARFLCAHPDYRSDATQAAKNLAVAPDNAAARRLVALSHGDLALLRREWNEKTKRHFTEIRVDDVRAAIHMFQQASGEGGWRIALIDSAEDLNASSANALLKLIEEPPPRSLFLIVAHKPGRVIATIRSRCRRLDLEPLSAEDAAEAARQALRTQGERFDDNALRHAAERAQGSVRETLRLVGGAGREIDRLAEQAFALLPKIDWRQGHRLAEAVSGRGKENEYEAFLKNVFDWLSAQVKSRRNEETAHLAPYAIAWEKIEEGARELDIYNLDKRAFALSVLADLAAAARGELG